MQDPYDETPNNSYRARSHCCETCDGAGTLDAYHRARVQRDAVSQTHYAAAYALNNYSPEKSPLGLTPDHVRATPEWRKLHAVERAAWHALQAFNVEFVNTYASEIRAERDRKRS